MEEQREEHQGVERIEPKVEQPDIDALRGAYTGPSRLSLRWERISQRLKGTLWTAVLALAIVVVLAVGYLVMN